MISTVVFHPTETSTNDGWIETGAPLLGPPQPPNRVLPAPIFDVGTQYQPNNGNTGRWVIEKTVFSDVAGPGFLIIPAGSFPGAGGIYSDDAAVVRLNGVQVPFTGSGTGVIAAQAVPVTWLAGANVLQIEVNNTVAGGTAVTGRLVASGPGVPCDCCPTGPPRCVMTEVVFDGVHTLVFQGGPGVVGSSDAVGLARWSDNDISGGNFTGFNTPAVQLTAATSPIIDLSFAVPQNRVRGLREWNQGGGDLGDLDGFASWDVEFFAGLTSLTTGNMIMGNGGAPFTFLLPGQQELSGVTRVRLSNMRKLNPGSTVSPLVREVRALQIQAAYPCRRATGALEWYTTDGDRVATADVLDCP